jgi:hypothetical protein
MNAFRLTLLFIFFFFSSPSNAQNVALIGSSEEFILQSVKGYSSVESRGIEHEEFDVLVFSDKGRELSFYFTFFRGDKVCSYVKIDASPLMLKDEFAYIKTHFTNVRDNIWENASKTVHLDIIQGADRSVILAKALR